MCRSMSVSYGPKSSFMKLELLPMGDAGPCLTDLVTFSPQKEIRLTTRSRPHDVSSMMLAPR